MYGLRSLGLVGQLHNGSDRGDSTGNFLERYDPDFLDGMGAAWWTDDPERAMRWETPQDAITALYQVPACRPTRDDGRPNRPLMAYTVEVVRLPVMASGEPRHS